MDSPSHASGEMNGITRCAPVFAVASPPDIARYYAATLGFSVQGAPLQEYAIVVRDGYEIHFIDRHSEASGAARGDKGGAYFTVGDPDSIFDELRTAGAIIHYPPTDQLYGMRDFAVLDPEGYWLCFGKKIG